MERWCAPEVSAGYPRTALSVLVAQRGTSLVELLISTLFVAILMAMSYSFARAALTSARIQEAKTEAQEATVMALDVLARDLRTAGFSAAGNPLTAVRAAGAEQVKVVADLNGDGDTEDANEVIGYSYNDQKHQLMRATGDASPQPFVPNVPPGGVRFAFFDAADSELSTAGRTLTTAERRRIHRIDVRIRVELPNPDPGRATPLASTVSTTVCLRNQ